jgi:hypothetical protein
MAYKDNEIDISDLKIAESAHESMLATRSRAFKADDAGARDSKRDDSAWVCPVCANTGPPSY